MRGSIAGRRPRHCHPNSLPEFACHIGAGAWLGGERTSTLHAAAPRPLPFKGRLIRCTLPGSTPKRLAILRTPSVRPGAFRAQFWRYSRPPELLALCLGPPKSGPHPLLNNRALELGEDAKHLKHGLATRRVTEFNLSQTAARRRTLLQRAHEVRGSVASRILAKRGTAG